MWISNLLIISLNQLWRYMRRWTGFIMVQAMLVARSASNYYLTQCWLIVSCTFRDKIQCNLESTFTNMHLRSPSVIFCPPGDDKYCRPLPNRAKPEASELDIAKINLNWHARSPVNTMGLTSSTKPITMLIANVKSTPARTATNMSAGFCRKRQYAMQYSTKPLPTTNTIKVMMMAPNHKTLLVAQKSSGAT